MVRLWLCLALTAYSLAHSSVDVAGNADNFINSPPSRGFKDLTKPSPEPPQCRKAADAGGTDELPYDSSHFMQVRVSLDEDDWIGGLSNYHSNGQLVRAAVGANGGVLPISGKHAPAASVVPSWGDSANFIQTKVRVDGDVEVQSEEASFVDETGHAQAEVEADGTLVMQDAAALVQTEVDLDDGGNAPPDRPPQPATPSDTQFHGPALQLKTMDDPFIISQRLGVYNDEAAFIQAQVESDGGLTSVNDEQRMPTSASHENTQDCMQVPVGVRGFSNVLPEEQSNIDLASEDAANFMQTQAEVGHDDVQVVDEPDVLNHHLGTYIEGDELIRAKVQADGGLLPVIQDGQGLAERIDP